MHVPQSKKIMEKTLFRHFLGTVFAGDGHETDKNYKSLDDQGFTQ